MRLKPSASAVISRGPLAATCAPHNSPPPSASNPAPSLAIGRGDARHRQMQQPQHQQAEQGQDGRAVAELGPGFADFVVGIGADAQHPPVQPRRRCRSAPAPEFPADADTSPAPDRARRHARRCGLAPASIIATRTWRLPSKLCTSRSDRLLALARQRQQRVVHDAVARPPAPCPFHCPPNGGHGPAPPPPSTDRLSSQRQDDRKEELPAQGHGNSSLKSAAS